MVICPGRTEQAHGGVRQSVMSLREKCDELEGMKTIVLTPSPPPRMIHSHLGHLDNVGEFG